MGQYLSIEFIYKSHTITEIYSDHISHFKDSIWQDIINFRLDLHVLQAQWVYHHYKCQMILSDINPEDKNKWSIYQHIM